MMRSIFSTTDTAEDRQICERMVSKNLDLAQRENILLLTGIPQDSPYYSIPTTKKRSIFQLFFHHALRIAARVDNPPLFTSITAATAQASSLSERVIVPSGCDPLSMPNSPPPVAGLPTNGSTVSPVSFAEDKRSATPTFFHYQLVLALQAARLLKWRKSVPIPALAQDLVEPSAPAPVATLQKNESPQSRFHGVSSSTGFVTPDLRSYLFGCVMDEHPNQEEMTPLLTPLQRAIAQAREHGYHLHPRQPLSISTSPVSPSQRSPPGLAHLKNRYTLRSHQVAASDYFRKEASHRAAVATRNLNRHILIQKTDRSLYEPSGIIMPDYEITRLRVVLAPRRFPIRLWKREYRGPADCIEVEDRSPTGGPAIFKRDSHLRKELVLCGRRRGACRKSAPAPPLVEEQQQSIPATINDVKPVQTSSTVAPVEPAAQEPSKVTTAQLVNLIQTMRTHAKAIDQAICEGPSLTEEHGPYEKKKGVVVVSEVGDSSAPTLKPSGLRVNTELSAPAPPGSLDPVAAEIHRKALLKKYYNAAPKSVNSASLKNAVGGEATSRSVDPSSSEETLCGDTTQDTVDKSKATTVDPQKETPNVVVSSSIAKLRTVSNTVEDRHSRLSLSPRKALRAMKNQAKSLVF